MDHLNVPKLIQGYYHLFTSLLEAIPHADNRLIFLNKSIVTY